MNFCDRPLIITDVETTGLNPEVHEIIDIGAIKVDQDLNILEVFEAKLRPTHIETAEIDALLVNGYKECDWLRAFDAGFGARSFKDFSKDCILCSWSIKFEYSFLSALWKQEGLANPVEHFRYTFDIPSMVWMTMGKVNSLHKDDIAALLDIPSEEKPHNGIGGAYHELQILRAMRKKS